MKSNFCCVSCQIQFTSLWIMIILLTSNKMNASHFLQKTVFGTITIEQIVLAILIIQLVYYSTQLASKTPKKQ